MPDSYGPTKQEVAINSDQIKISKDVIADQNELWTECFTINFMEALLNYRSFWFALYFESESTF